MISVFSKGEWLSVITPTHVDPCWSKNDLLFYATIYSASFSIHGDKKRANIIAEVAVNKRLYPELKYNSAIESELSSLFTIS
jgi:hypothetical protein